MKKFAALLIAVALITPAFAQKLSPAFAPKTTFQGTHPRPKLALVAPASNPVLLHTGKPITPDQKQQLMLSVTKGTATRPPMGAARVSNSVLSSELNMLTPDQLFVNGAYIQAYGVRIDQYDGVLVFGPGDSNLVNPSSMVIHVTVKPNTVYTLLIKLNVDFGYLDNPNYPFGIHISAYSGQKTAGGLNAPQIFNPAEGENEFAYSFITNSAGDLPITIYGSNLNWSFESCEITSAAY